MNIDTIKLLVVMHSRFQFCARIFIDFFFLHLIHIVLRLIPYNRMVLYSQGNPFS
eukprot:UN21423